MAASACTGWVRRLAKGVVLPSRWEARSLVAQEALLAGRAVIAADVGGLPERLGDYRSVKRRYYRWIEMGVLDDMLETLAREADLEWLMIDSTIVRAHQQAASGKGGPRIRRWGAPEAD